MGGDDVLSTDDDPIGRYDNSVREQPFSTVISRRNKRRQQSSPSTAANPQSRQVQQVEQAQRRAVVAGRSAASGGKIAAAKKLRKKAIFCLDNVSNSCTVQDVIKMSSRMFLTLASKSCLVSKRNPGDDEDRKK